MQMLEAQKLAREWGHKPCSHPALSKEHHLGSATGDYACTTCGKTDVGRNWNKRQAKTEEEVSNG